MSSTIISSVASQQQQSASVSTTSSSPNNLKKTFIEELIGEEVSSTEESSGQYTQNTYRMKRTAQKTQRSIKAKDTVSSPQANAKNEVEMIVTKKLIITTANDDLDLNINASSNDLASNPHQVPNKEETPSKIYQKTQANGTKNAVTTTKSSSGSESSTSNDNNHQNAIRNNNNGASANQPTLIKKEQLEYEFHLKPNTNSSQKKPLKLVKKKQQQQESEKQSSTKSNNSHIKKCDSKSSVGNSSFSFVYLLTSCFRKQNNNFYCCYCFDAPSDAGDPKINGTSSDKTVTDGANFTCKNCFSCVCLSSGSRGANRARSKNLSSIYKEECDKVKIDLNESEAKGKEKESTSLFRNSKKRFSFTKGLMAKKNSSKMAKDDSLENEEYAEPPPITCIRVLRPSNDLTPVRFDSHYNIIQTLNSNTLNGSDSLRSLNSNDT